MRELNLPLPVARAVLTPLYWASLHARLPFRVQRKLLDISSHAQLLPAGTVVRRIRLAGRPAERLTVTATPTDTEAGAILYLHGGGYVVGSLATHRSLGARLARAAECPVYSLDYRLAPEHPLPAGLDDAEAAFLELVSKHGYRPERIAVSGDSAGGGLALALAQRLIANHGITPGALGLIAPWTDPNEVPERNRDLVISKPWSRLCAAAYLGAADGTDFGYAPLTGVLHALPPTYIQVDESELLHPQCVALAEALRGAGVHVRFTETRGLWHVAQLQAGLVGPAAAALSEMAEFLSDALHPADLRELG
ncbi:alpha/beta hydrolase [Nocardia asteroides]|uniref:alpha/beta hydrolase n=1 Tax=Nocardia asteroides TaxID=1824 RepID=UPI001E5A4977|nr:alpha/beta hydrolase [Nocardia asteroides]UGT64192.1 alpha/beta hydrolase [Nocardia asteroides]